MMTLVLCAGMTFPSSSALALNNGIEVNFGTRGCVCKSGGCSDSGVISFREFCGHRPSGSVPSGPGADLGCQAVDNGACDD